VSERGRRVGGDRGQELVSRVVGRSGRGGPWRGGLLAEARRGGRAGGAGGTERQKQARSRTHSDSAFRCPSEEKEALTGGALGHADARAGSAARDDGERHGGRKAGADAGAGALHHAARGQAGVETRRTRESRAPPEAGGRRRGPGPEGESEDAGAHRGLGQRHAAARADAGGGEEQAVRHRGRGERAQRDAGAGARLALGDRAAARGAAGSSRADERTKYAERGQPAHGGRTFFACAFQR
jgi:hypothetical protein